MTTAILTTSAEWRHQRELLRRLDRQHVTAPRRAWQMLGMLLAVAFAAVISLGLVQP